MVYFESLGSWWEAPASAVWEYLGSNAQRAAHAPTVRGWSAEEVVPSTAHFDAERLRAGAWEPFAGRRTRLSPVCVIDEELEGVLAGSRIVQLYTPAGERTRRDTFAEYTSDELDMTGALETATRLLADDEREDRNAVRRAGIAPPPTGPPGIRLSDEGSVFDAAVPVVWAYLADGRRHDRVHRATRQPVYRPLGSGSFLFSCERRIDGSWHGETMRLRALEPLAIATEWIDGLLTGSKMISIYRPVGATTRIDLHGHFVSTTLDERDLERVVRSAWETEFDEDSVAIRRLASTR